MPAMNELPISHILPDLKTAMTEHNRLVVVAPPGAGKSTLLPLALLDSLHKNNEEAFNEPKQQIWLLEPRRLAASQVANRLAHSLGEKLGDTIG